MGDKYKWRDDKKADSMSRLEEVSSEQCGTDIKWMKQQKIVHLRVKRRGATIIQYKWVTHILV
jgi:hypothetical protein